IRFDGARSRGSASVETLLFVGVVVAVAVGAFAVLGDVTASVLIGGDTSDADADADAFDFAGADGAGHALGGDDFEVLETSDPGVGHDGAGDSSEVTVAGSGSGASDSGGGPGAEASGFTPSGEGSAGDPSGAPPTGEPP